MKIQNFKTQEEIWRWLLAGNLVQNVSTKMRYKISNGKVISTMTKEGDTYAFFDTDAWVGISAPKQVKYLKPLHQVLSEAPTYSVSIGGSIDSEAWEDSITTSMLQYFGKPMSEIDKGYTYCDTWIEKREVSD